MQAGILNSVKEEASKLRSRGFLVIGSLILGLNTNSTLDPQSWAEQVACLLLQRGVLDRFQEEDVGDEGEVQANCACAVHQQDPAARVMLQELFK